MIRAQGRVCGVDESRVKLSNASSDLVDLGNGNKATSFPRHAPQLSSLVS